jgi:hypothetical protein
VINPLFELVNIIAKNGRKGNFETTALKERTRKENGQGKGKIL